MDGSIFRSMADRVSVLVVSFDSLYPLRPFTPKWRELRTVRMSTDTCIEQYALTEASYTVVRLLQHFDCLESADPDPRLEPIKQSNLTMMHDHGVPVKLYASK